MKSNQLKTKILGLIIAFIIAIILSAIISTILHLIFTKVPEEILNIRPNTIIESLTSSKEHLEMFILTISAFMLLTLLTIFKVFDLKDYKSKTYKVTNNIEIPLPIGDKQTQQGSAWWLSSKDFSKKFGVNRVDLQKKEFKELIRQANEDKQFIKNDEDNPNNIKIKSVFKSGGLVIGKKDKRIPRIRIKKLGRFIKIPYLTIKKVEDIYYIDDDLHSLTVGATRSGKTRNLVLQTIINTGLSGENMIISDPKGELYEYTSKTLERLGYKVYTLDFKTPLKSSKYNFLEPVIEAFSNNDIPKAVNYCSDIVESLVGEVGNREAIWVNGEKSVIKAGIMSVVLGNKKHREYQNLPNTYHFISKMCTEQEDKSMLMDTFLETLPESHPAIASFAAARIAPSKTRASFFTSALSTLSIFMDAYVASMISESEIDLNKFNEESSVLYMILPDEKTTFYSLCSLFVNQVYTKLVELADSKGGRLKIRTNFILDEFGNFSAIPNFGGFLTVGGGRGIRFNLFVQSFSQLNEKYGDNTAQNILDNCYVWNYLKTSNEVTAEKISKKIGTYTTSSWSESNSSSGGAVNKSNSMNLTQRALLTTDEILRIERPYLLVMCSGLSPAMTYSPDLSKWYFNSILGLGDKEWNTKVREYRENHRKVRKITPLNLWDIVEKTKIFKKALSEENIRVEKEKRMKNINLEGKL